MATKKKGRCNEAVYDNLGQPEGDDFGYVCYLTKGHKGHHIGEISCNTKMVFSDEAGLEKEVWVTEITEVGWK
jgi:hypothetical protein